MYIGLKHRYFGLLQIRDTCVLSVGQGKSENYQDIKQNASSQNGFEKTYRRYSNNNSTNSTVILSEIYGDSMHRSELEKQFFFFHYNFKHFSLLQDWPIRK